jgi:hypothetical protein
MDYPKWVGILASAGRNQFYGKMSFMVDLIFS